MSLYKIPGYKKEKDYSEEIRRAASAGDTAGAACFEEARNRKIAGERLNYPKTYDYIDVGNKLRAGMENGASGAEIGELLDARRHKANTNPALSSFKNDEIQRQGERYYFNKVNGVGGNYENRPTYNPKYESKLDEMLDRVLSGEQFSYNPQNDPAYRAYEKQYTREGERAMKDTLATLAATAGGMNSNAVSAAAQANNYYMKQLSDKIPELYSMAYDMYRNQRNDERQNLALISELDNNDFNRYLNNMNIYQNDVARAENMYNDRYNQSRADDEWRYGLEKDKKNEENTRLWQMLQNGLVPTDSAAEAAGFTPEQVKAIADIYASEIDYNKNVRDMDLRDRALDYAIQNFNYNQMLKEAAGAGTGGGSVGSSGGRSSGGSGGSGKGGGKSSGKSGTETVKKASDNVNISDIIDYVNEPYKASKGANGERRNMRMANLGAPIVNSGDTYAIGKGRENEVIARVMSKKGLTEKQALNVLRLFGLNDEEIRNALK